MFSIRPRRAEGGAAGGGEPAGTGGYAGAGNLAGVPGVDESGSTVEGRPLDEAEIMERARRGDAAAYEELVLRYGDVAFRTAYVVTGSAAEAEEAAQDGFVRAYRALPGFRAGAPFRPWLLRIVGNEARNRRRAAGRRSALELRLAEGLRVGGAAPSPEAAFEAAEERRALLRALAELPSGSREVIVCRHLLDLSVEETAAALGLPEGTVKSRLHRGLERLRGLLEPVHG